MKSKTVFTLIIVHFFGSVLQIEYHCFGLKDPISHRHPDHLSTPIRLFLNSRTSTILKTTGIRVQKIVEKKKRNLSQRTPSFSVFAIGSV